MKCLLLDIDMPVGSTCLSPDNPGVINAKINNWERFKKETMKSGKRLGKKEVKEVKDTTKMEMKETKK